ncbi:hypothetical protein ES332_D10G128000v1 [Gossypium tomentosum]|uniref:Uncharacterized protein n=1 Tax=Gossypium tomentosum TaxID=34277 RepID=A0A5D2J4Y0_GOSTO|nr:hypothetical protein ES332_D10G128000v1 [Gossypium tomentosum]
MCCYAWSVWLHRNLFFWKGVANSHQVRPEGNTVKCNKDAAVSIPLNMSSFAAIGRNNAGTFVRGLSGTFHGILNPFLAELLHIREVLLWMKDELFYDVNSESDCKHASPKSY